MKKKIFVTMVSLLMLAAMPMTFAATNNVDENAVITEGKKDFTEIQISEVPDAVMQAVQNDAPGQQVTKAEKAEKDGDTIYKITVGSGENEQTLKYKSDGTKYEMDKDKY